MAQEADDMRLSAYALHNTSSRAPYERIENRWQGIRERANPLLDTASNLLLMLDETVDDGRKKAAIDLIVTYQNEVEHVVHYASSSVYYARTESAITTTPTDTTNRFLKLDAKNRVLSLLDGKSLELDDALRDMKFEEHRYEKACRVSFP